MKKQLSVIICAGLLLWGCKPTEKNYEAAYSKAAEAARLKAEAEKASDTGAELESIDGPRIENIGEESVYVGNTRIKPFEVDGPMDEGSYGIAIAKYSMPTNARRHLQDVRKKYPNAFIATDGKQDYYVVIKRVMNVPEAADPIRIYKQDHPNDPYLGLQGEPAVYFVTP